MDIFIRQVAHWVSGAFGKDLSQLKIIFPNKRSGLFFRHYLSENISKPVWAPVITDISAYMQKLSTLKLADPYTLLFDLYESYKKVLTQHGREPETFDKFYSWGNILLDDFNEIDKYLVNAQDLFRNISALKSIDNYFDYLTKEQIETLSNFWRNINLSKNSREKESFIRIWEILFDIYSDFRKNILDKNYAYEGLIYRDVYNTIKNESLKEQAEKVIFTGFNYLTKAEHALFGHFQLTDQGIYFWDDQPGLKWQHFPPFENVREMNKQFPSPDSFREKIMTQTPEPLIRSVGVSLSAGQAKFVGNDIHKQSGQYDTFDHTAIILADENMLMPVLRSLPSDIPTINITMGYPLRNTQLAGFLELILALHKHSRAGSKQTYFYYKNVLALLKHPYIKQLNPVEINNKINTLEYENSIYIPGKDLAELIPNGHLYFPEKKQQPDFTYLLSLLELLYQSKFIGKNKLEHEFIYSFYKELKRIGELVNTKAFELSEQVFYSIIREVVNAIKLPFTGEPLSGLQIMGMLETRCLNFKNIFILNMNEGIMPPLQSGSSYIPYFLRKGFGLPTYDQQGKVLSYYFYRLIFNAEQVTLLYNAEAESVDGEISRYVKQLKYDLGYPVKEYILTHPIKTDIPQTIVIRKDEQAKERLRNYLISSENPKRFAPSALNTYLDCSLKFYFKYLAGLKESKEVEEEVDQRILGNILHDSMEFIYRNFLTESKRQNSLIQTTDFKEIEKHIEKGIQQAFANHFKKQEDSMIYEGQNLIIRNVIHRYVKQILKTDKQHAPFEIISMENKEHEYLLDIEVELEHGKKENVGLKGIIDRVDRKGKLVRILDYKSGGDAKTFNGIASLFDKGIEKRNKAVFQTILYSLFYAGTDDVQSTDIMPCIYNVREMFTNDFDYKLQNKEQYKTKVIEDISPYLGEFKVHLTALLQEIFAEETEFSQTDDEKKCRYCPYTGICRRD